MHRIAFFLAFIAFAACQDGPRRTNTAAVPKIEVTITQSPVKVGTNVTVMCRIEGREPETQRWWTKAVPGARNAGRHVISTGGRSKLPPYTSMNRYTLSSNLEEGTVQYHYLNINGVQKEDSGIIYCGVVADSSEFNITGKMVYLDVYNDVDNVTLYQNMTEEVTTVSVTEGESVSITCKSFGGTPTPSLKVTVGGENRTADFSVSMEWRYFCAKQGDSTCSIHADRIITAKNATFRPTYKDNNKDLVCNATIPGMSGFTPKVDKLTLQVRYHPTFECAMEQKARLNQIGVVRCKVLGHPAISNVYWKVFMGSEPLQIPGENGPAVQGITPSRQTMNNEESEYVLTITKVGPTHFAKYTIYATNDLSTKEKEITFREDTSPVGGVPGPFASLIATLLLAALAYILH